MNNLEILVKVKRITEDMIKEAFIFKAIRENSILSLDTEDVINLYPYNAYDYRVDGKNLDYVITEDSVALLADLARINNWNIDNIKYADFNDCISISTGEDTLSIICKDGSVRNGERMVFINKVLMKKYGIDIKMKLTDDKLLTPLEKIFENPINVIVESLLILPLYFVINPIHLGLELIADSYIYVLTKGLNRVPTNADIAEYLINENKLNDDYIRVYVLRRDLELFKEYFDVEVYEKNGSLDYVINESHALTASIMQGGTASDLLKVSWINMDSFRVNGISINLVDLGSTNVLECSDLLINRVKEEFRGIL
nr:MAG: hypothetical protein TU36_05075 [Vulcanisaeta sp. AZ3]